MSEQVSLVQEGAERVGDAYRSFDEGFQRLQKDLRNRRKTFERQIKTSRKDIEKRTRKQVNELRKNPVVKRAISVRDDASKRFESQIGDVLGFLNIATRTDIERIERKLGQITRKLKQTGRTKKANGSATSKAS